MSNRRSLLRGSAYADSDAAEERPSGIKLEFNGLSLNPFRLAASRPARRVFLAAASFTLASLPLLGLAALAYVVFYYNYVPVRGFTAPAHFQFGYLSGEGAVRGAAAAAAAAAAGGAGAGNLRAAVRLPDGFLVAGQAYDVAVELRMPRVARNLEAGNFMLDLQLLAGGGGGGGAPTRTERSEEEEKGAPLPVVARERRPASLTYRSPPVEWMRKAAALPLYVVGWWREEERLAVPLMEGVTFAASGRRAALPTNARIELLTDARLQIYSAQLSFRTKLKGLRYIMYNFRTISFVVFTAMFWAVEMSVAAAVWIYLTVTAKDEDTTKEEGADVKSEGDSPESAVKAEPDLDSGSEADVEDAEGPLTAVGSHGRLDSDAGVGTSTEASAVRRRPSVKQEDEG